MNSQKKFFGDFALTFMGLFLYNAILQFFVYPQLNRVLGDTVYGEVLYYISIFSITSVALGLASCNTRLVKRNYYPISNGDCNIYNLSVIGIFTVIVAVILSFQKIAAADIIFVLVIQCLMALRYYCETIYRINTDYKQLLVYYIMMCLGYTAGTVIFFYVQKWYIPFLLGEAAAIIFANTTTQLRNKPFKTSDNLAVFSKSASPLLVSYLLYYLVLNLDRIIIRNAIDSSAVGPYYVATLIGKTASLIIGPLSSVIIGYITKEKITIKRKQFTHIALLTAGVGLLFYLATVIGTPIFTKLFYPNFYGKVFEIMFIVNLGQVLCFMSEFLLIIVLTFRHEKWQMIIQAIYAVVFIVSSLMLVGNYGLIGIAISTALANGIRLILAIVLGIYKNK